VYGRLGDVRHRSDVVEYRAEQHFDWQGGKWHFRAPFPVVATNAKPRTSGTDGGVLVC
jgi:hypothetical protein